MEVQVYHFRCCEIGQTFFPARVDHMSNLFAAFLDLWDVPVRLNPEGCLSYALLHPCIWLCVCR